MKALVALLERRAKALAPLARADAGDPRRARRRCTKSSDASGATSLQQPKKALENFRRAIDLDPSSAYAIYGAREIYKALGQWNDALPMYEAELELERDPARRVALLRDEATTRRAAGISRAPRRRWRARARSTIRTRRCSRSTRRVVVERSRRARTSRPQERTIGAELLVGLAEIYDGEHGLAYSAGALDIEPGHDRALQLYAYYAHALQREDDVASATSPTSRRTRTARWRAKRAGSSPRSYEAAGTAPRAPSRSSSRCARSAIPTRQRRSSASSTRRLGQRMPTRRPPLPSATPGATRAGAAAPAAPDPVAARSKVESALDAAQTLSKSGKRRRGVHEVPRGARVRSGAPRGALVGRGLPADEARLRAAARRAPRGACASPANRAESRTERLREVAGLCEGNLRDIDGAINAWKQLLAIDRSDDAARASRSRALLEKTQRWDDLANLLEQEATAESDLEKKIALEKKLATLQETEAEGLRRRGRGVGSASRT